MPRVPNVSRVKSNFRRNLLSSGDTSAESHNHPFQLMDGVDDTTEMVSEVTTLFSAIVGMMRETEVQMEKRDQGYFIHDLESRNGPYL
jgi:hypothetical protein